MKNLLKSVLSISVVCASLLLNCSVAVSQNSVFSKQEDSNQLLSLNECQDWFSSSPYSSHYLGVPAFRDLEEKKDNEKFAEYKKLNRTFYAIQLLAISEEDFTDFASALYRMANKKCISQVRLQSRSVLVSLEHLDFSCFNTYMRFLISALDKLAEKHTVLFNKVSEDSKAVRSIYEKIVPKEEQKLKVVEKIAYCLHELISGDREQFSKDLHDYLQCINPNLVSQIFNEIKPRTHEVNIRDTILSLLNSQVIDTIVANIKSNRKSRVINLYC